MSTTTPAGPVAEPRRLGKRDLAQAIADELGVHPKDASRAVTAMLDTITRALIRGDEVTVSNFGTFKRMRLSQRAACNPKTGERVTAPAIWVVRFRATGNLAELIKNGQNPETASIAKRPSTPRTTS